MVFHSPGSQVGTVLMQHHVGCFCAWGSFEGHLRVDNFEKPVVRAFSEQFEFRLARGLDE